MFSQDDDNQGLVLGILFGVIALVISLVIGVSIYKTNSMAAATPAPAAADVTTDGASVKVVDGVVKFYFASGKADVAAGGNEALAEVVKAVATGKKVLISGFHDASGDPALNAELAKQRALAVRDALKTLGVPEDKVELKKPEQALANGPAPEARRVEVVVQ
jgi:outer membrane protein OmpA-like peptidoglycan-associated protein